MFDSKTPPDVQESYFPMLISSPNASVDPGYPGRALSMALQADSVSLKDRWRCRARHPCDPRLLPPDLGRVAADFLPQLGDRQREEHVIAVRVSQRVQAHH